MSKTIHTSHPIRRRTVHTFLALTSALILVATVVLGSSPATGIAAEGESTGSASNGRVPCEELLPSNTKASFVIKDFAEMQEKLEQTGLGALFTQEELKPFVEELQSTIEKQLTDANKKLGFEVADIQGIRSGEIGFASILPDAEGHAVAAIVDAAGNEDAAMDLIKKIKDRLEEEGAKEQEALTEADQTIYDMELPLERGAAVIEHVYFAIADGYFIAADHEEVIRSLVRSAMDEQPEDYVSLAGTDAYKAIVDRLLEAKGNPEGDARWFVEPFGLAKSIRNAIPPEERGQEIMKILRDQGFKAIQGMGGDISIGVGPFELMHRTFVLAPPTTEPGEDGIRYDLAARALKFENTERANLQPFPFLLPTTSTHVTFNWDMENAFSSLGSLVDDIIDSEGAFDRMLHGMKHAPDGPKVDIEAELIRNFEPRLTMVSDVVKPIKLNSERVMMVIRVRNPEVVAEAVAKIMRVEPGVVAVELGEHTIWHKDPANVEREDPEDDIPIFNPFPVDVEEEEPVKEESLAGWNSFGVIDGYLFIANSIDLMKEVLDSEDRDQLTDAEDFQRVESALAEISGGEIAFTQFGRLDEVMRVTYELLRQGKMPESQSLLGEFLNRQLGEDEPGVVRDQKIDPASLPEGDEAYDRLIAPFIGPSGWSGITEENGFFITGGILPKAQTEREASTDDESD